MATITLNPMLVSAVTGVYHPYTLTPLALQWQRLSDLTPEKQLAWLTRHSGRAHAKKKYPTWGELDLRWKRHEVIALHRRLERLGVKPWITPPEWNI